MRWGAGRTVERTYGRTRALADPGYAGTAMTRGLTEARTSATQVRKFVVLAAYGIALTTQIGCLINSKKKKKKKGWCARHGGVRGFLPVLLL